MNRIPKLGVALTLLTTLAGFPAHAATSTPAIADASGGVYTANNSTETNEVIAYRRADDGTLTYIATYETGGRGSGGAVDPLQSQNSILLSPDHHWLFVANSGTSDITVFEVNPDASLHLIGRTPSRGGFPVSLALYNNLLYVLNSGGAGDVSGFRVLANGSLQPIANSTQLLSAASAGGSSIDFSPDGTVLAAAERLTNKIDIFPIGSSGAAGAPVFNKSNGAVPFALTFTPQGALVVAEAGGGRDGGSAVSSYTVGAGDMLTLVSGSVPTGFDAGCWLVATANGELAFDANAASSEISVETIGDDGSIATVGSASAGTGAVPLDLALSGNDRYLYALTTGTGTITGFEIGLGGTLTSIGSVPSLPATSGQNGLAAY